MSWREIHRNWFRLRGDRRFELPVGFTREKYLHPGRRQYVYFKLTDNWVWGTRWEVSEMSKTTYWFDRVLQHHDEQLVLKEKAVKVKAKTLDDAFTVVNQRRDANKKVKGGYIKYVCRKIK